MHPSAIELARIPLRGATPPLGLRWGFEATSNDSRSTCMPKFRMIKMAGEMHSGRFNFRIKMFDRRGSGAHKCLFFLQINKSHKVVVCVNKKN